MLHYSKHHARVLSQHTRLGCMISETSHQPRTLHSRAASAKQDALALVSSDRYEHMLQFLDKVLDHNKHTNLTGGQLDMPSKHLLLLRRACTKSDGSEQLSETERRPSRSTFRTPWHCCLPWTPMRRRCLMVRR